MNSVSNINNLFPNDSVLFFRTAERPLIAQLRYGKTAPIATHKAVMRAHPVDRSPVVLGVVGRNYSVVRNESLMKAVENSFMQELTAEQLRDVKVQDHESRGGAACLREYYFPNVRCDLRNRQHETEIGFRTIVQNTFDGSSPIKMMSGAIDMFCTNGMIIGEYDMFGRKHVGNIEEMLERNWNDNIFARHVRSAVQRFSSQSTLWQQFIDTPFPCDHAYEFLKKLPGMSERKAEKLSQRVQVEREDRGDNFWAVYSAMTFYASHDEYPDFKLRNTGNDNRPEAMLNREQEVRAWINSEAFRSKLREQAA